MKKGVIALCMMLTGLAAEGQYSEFKTHDNGLIYDKTTMDRLAIIVDSLNLKFKSCDLTHPYYSYPQGLAYYYKLSKAQMKVVRNGISLDDFKARYPKEVAEETWIIKRRYKEENGSWRILYSGLPYGWSQEHAIELKASRSNDKDKGWVVDEENQDAFYISGLARVELAQPYARLVQYVDCMIDTTAEIFFSGAQYEVYQVVKPNSKAAQFITWADDFPGKPAMPDLMKVADSQIDSVYASYSGAHRHWDSLRLSALDEKIRHAAYWKSLLIEAKDEAISSGNSDGRLEFYVARYLSKEDALKMKRSRKVMGNCSQDLSPRYHAMEICKLAAETAQWDIFLRSHLDVMNDRFARQTDGSYAWAGRKTYLKELEKLDIHASDLLLGTCFRIANVSDNHYRGDISRIGRALTDTQDPEMVEAQIASIIRDDSLDPYNRLIFVYLLSHYAENLSDDARKASVKAELKALIEALPTYIRTVLEKG